MRKKKNKTRSKNLSIPVREREKGETKPNSGSTKLRIENNTADRGGARKGGYVASTVESVLDQL